jgi:hypothetical protein
MLLVIVPALRVLIMGKYDDSTPATEMADLEG